MGKYRKFSQQYRDEAVQMVLATARPVAEVARDLGVNESTLSNWVSRYRVDHPVSEELFTGGDVAYAPDPLRIPPHTARYRRYRTSAARTLDQDRPLQQTAHHELGRLSEAGPITGPLTWTPVEPAALYTDDSVRLLMGQPAQERSTSFAPF